MLHTWVVELYMGNEPTLWFLGSSLEIYTAVIDKGIWYGSNLSDKTSSFGKEWFLKLSFQIYLYHWTILVIFSCTSNQFLSLYAYMTSANVRSILHYGELYKSGTLWGTCICLILLLRKRFIFPMTVIGAILVMKYISCSYVRESCAVVLRC